MQKLLIITTFLLSFFLFSSSAQALEFKITNNSGLDPSEVFVNVVGAPGQYDVPGMTNNTPVALNTIPDQEITINQLVSGRIYISYNSGVLESVPFTSQTRFDWAELTVTPNSADVANLTAVDQFGIGMRLKTYNQSGTQLEELGTANSKTVFDALQSIPGGAAATVRDSENNIIRVLSPNKSSAYPLLENYVKSMSGKQISLNTAFYGSPFVTSSYSGTFQSDGSITLTGSTNPAGNAPASLNFAGDQIISDIYTGGNTPNTLSGAIYRDLLAGFSTGMWGGKYGNQALDFCFNPIQNNQGSWCPNGFNKPAFGDARNQQEAYATCEQYAAVINQFSDSYGNPYSDASKKTTVSLNQPVDGGNVTTLELVIQADQGSAMPVNSGNPNCGAKSKTKPQIKFFYPKKLVFKNLKRKAFAVKIKCSPACSNTGIQAKRNGKIVFKGSNKKKTGQVVVYAKLTKYGKKLLKNKKRLKVKIFVKTNQSAKKINRKITRTISR
jgi:hypothetical protein